MSLRCANLELRVPGRVICRDVSVSFERGEVWAVLGRNGSGKSTLLHALAGLSVPAAGSVGINFGDAESIANARVRSRVLGLLLQVEEATYWGTVGEYVLLGRYPHTHLLRGYGRDDVEHALAALRALDLETYARQRFATLSGGERQRVRIAQIFAQTPRVYLLDEPLQHLDLAHQARVLNLIAARVREHAETAIMVLHEPLWITRSCTHVLIFTGDGSVVHGPADELLTRDNLERAYGCRLREVDHETGRSFVPDV